MSRAGIQVRRSRSGSPSLFPIDQPRDNSRNGSHGTRDIRIEFGPAEDAYPRWPTPVCIISDGPYGVNGYPGDEYTARTLAEWYEPHVRAWSEYASPQTTLWFWNTELGWATAHPVLAAHGWEYRSCHIWDKGLGHIAGNANTQTLRKFPVVTEVCVQYVRPAVFQTAQGPMSMQQWLRYEWQRSGLPLRLSNEACGVENAATRKYLTADHLWYYPPVEAFVKLADYANRHGKPAGRPYFSTDGKAPIPAAVWEKMRAKFNCEVGVTNVWRVPQVGVVCSPESSPGGMRVSISPEEGRGDERCRRSTPRSKSSTSSGKPRPSWRAGRRSPTSARSSG